MGSNQKFFHFYIPLIFQRNNTVQSSYYDKCMKSKHPNVFICPHKAPFIIPNVEVAKNVKILVDKKKELEKKRKKRNNKRSKSWISRKLKKFRKHWKSRQRRWKKRKRRIERRKQKDSEVVR